MELMVKFLTGNDKATFLIPSLSPLLSILESPGRDSLNFSHGIFAEGSRKVNSMYGWNNGLYRRALSCLSHFMA